MQAERQSRVTSLFKRIFKVKYWSDSERVKSFFHYVVEMFKRLFVIRPKPAKESFEQAKARLKLTDGALLKKERALFRLSVFMAVIGVLMVLYSLYQGVYGTFQGILLSLVVSLLAWVFAFRYHFWYFQIRQKKLGCSFMVWFNKGLLRRGRS